MKKLKYLLIILLITLTLLLMMLITHMITNIFHINGIHAHILAFSIGLLLGWILFKMIIKVNTYFNK
jgi:hypothetical protein